mmetsp:Transcript_62983/g.148318  ORF Transcript_62983/g.148318 Transcript_62983/m.148318 type:complete len:388 (-) Transcript_62983:529-1692(-)
MTSMQDTMQHRRRSRSESHWYSRQLRLVLGHSITAQAKQSSTALFLRGPTQPSSLLPTQLPALPPAVVLSSLPCLLCILGTRPTLLLHHRISHPLPRIFSIYAPTRCFRTPPLKNPPASETPAAGPVLSPGQTRLSCASKNPSPLACSCRRRLHTTHASLLLLCGAEHLERAHKGFVDRHHGTGVVELAAVVGRREHRHQLPAREELVPVLHDLVRAHDEVEVVFSVELLDDVRAEREGHAAVALGPAADVGVGVRPQHVAQQACVGHVRWTQDAPDLLHAVQVRGESSVYAEDLVVDDGGDGQAVEDHVERLPELERVAALALVVEPVDSVDRRALVVASKHEEVFGVLNLVRQKQADAFQALGAAVYIVAQEEVVGLGREPAVLK